MQINQICDLGFLWDFLFQKKAKLNINILVTEKLHPTFIISNWPHLEKFNRWIFYSTVILALRNTTSLRRKSLTLCRVLLEWQMWWHRLIQRKSGSQFQWGRRRASAARLVWRHRHAPASNHTHHQDLSPGRTEHTYMFNPLTLKSSARNCRLDLWYFWW